MQLKLLALAALLPACDESPCGDTEGVVSRVIDGDTIVLESGVKIRYLLVDTPEISSGGDCYGSNAQQFNSDLVLGKTVQLNFDVACTDMFGRTLAYVIVDGQEVNSLLVSRGYGCVLSIPPDGQSRLDEFKALQLDAMVNKRGLWGACNPLPPACK